MSFVFDDPVALTTAMLIGLRNLLSQSGKPVRDSRQSHLLHLKDFLIRSINNALKDGQRCVSNHLLICICLLASYDAKYESSLHSNYHTHMRGLVQMIKIRGGLKAIGVDTPWVERVLIWTDVNSSKIAGVQPYFSTIDKSPQYIRPPSADTEVFTARKQEDG